MQAMGSNMAQRNVNRGLPSLLERFGLFEKLPVTILLGGLLGLCSPGFNISWIAWVGLAPLLILALGANGLLEACALGLIYGLGYHLVCHRWILELYPLTMVQLPDAVSLSGIGLLWFIESLHQAVLFAVFALLVYALPMRAGILPYYKRPFYPFILTVPLIWIFLQWVIATSEPFFGLPINQLAYSQSVNLPVIQICSIGGSQLLELIIMAANAALAALVIELFPALVPALTARLEPLSAKMGAISDCVLIAMAFAFCLSFGTWRMARVVDLPPYSIASDKAVFAPPVPIALLQGNVVPRPQSMPDFERNETLNRYRSLWTDLGVALLILPEAVMRLDDAQSQALSEGLAKVCQQEKKEALSGSLEVSQNSLVNTVRLVSPDQAKNAVYVKNRLLPLVESVPFSAIEKAIPQNIFNLLPVSKDNFLEAQTPSLLKSVWGNVGASVSFEVLYPELISTEVQEGASLLVNIADLSWFHNTTLSKQLIAAAQVRAVENSRYLVMASNTGISAVVNPLGVVTSRTLYGQTGNLLDRVQFLHKTTQFTRMWWLWKPGYKLWH
ncbi:MAG: apolipoprotein N-acyltransferase [Candidatus Obscuribacterales bacterium]|nr:apolipoprotein N-acyltransferase [Candidatus Obscuribacterales bacterium]